MKKTVLLALLITSFTTIAQKKEKGNMEIVPYVGYSSFQYVNTDNEGSHSLDSGSFGVVGDYYFNNRWSLRTGLSYQTMGATRLMYVSDAPDNGKEKISYLNIPLNANWHFGSTRRWNLNFGLTPSFLLGATGDYPGLGANNVDFTEAVYSSQLGLSFGLGYKIPVSNNFSILVEYQRFIGLTDASRFTDINLRNSGINFNVGGVFKL